VPREKGVERGESQQMKSLGHLRVPQEENIYIESEQLGKSSIVKDTEKYRLK
jgi:hypothetical protein